MKVSVMLPFPIVVFLSIGIFYNDSPKLAITNGTAYFKCHHIAVPHIV